MVTSASTICLYNMSYCLHCTKEDSRLWRQGERGERGKNGNCASTKFSEWAELGLGLSYF